MKTLCPVYRHFLRGLFVPWRILKFNIFIIQNNMRSWDVRERYLTFHCLPWTDSIKRWQQFLFDLVSRDLPFNRNCNLVRKEGLTYTLYAYSLHFTTLGLGVIIMNRDVLKIELLLVSSIMSCITLWKIEHLLIFIRW